MKTILKFLMVLPLVALVASCQGKKPQQSGSSSYFVKLLIDKKQIDIDKAEKALFTVTADGQDVSKNAYIVNTTDGAYEILKDKSGAYVYDFEPLKPGQHSFIAVYGDNSSEIANVRAITQGQSTTFYRRNAVMKYTGTWCTYCPAMGDAIKEAAKKRPDRIIEVAVHNGDQLVVPIGNKLSSYASAAALPEVMVDYRYGSKVLIRVSNAILSEIDKSNDANPTVSGIKMDTKQEGNKIMVETETMVSRDGEYSLVVAILVDGFAYVQTGSNDPNYRQNNVLRAFLCKNPDINVYGDDLGKMVAQQRKPMSYSYELPTNEIDITRYRVVAFVLNKNLEGEYRINNIVECNVGQSSNYEYEAAE